MNCPKCNTKIVDKCCPRCGYLINGQSINLKDKPEKFIDEKNINPNFDKLYRNENSLIPALLGGLYLAFYKCPLIALLINASKWLIIVLVNYYVGRIPLLGVYAPIIMIILYIAFRLLFASISNSIILYYEKLKIKYYKKNYPNDYQKYLFKYKNTSIVYSILYLLIYMFLLLYFFTDTFK